MLEGKLHGRGVLEWSDGLRYEGELRGDKQHGHGTLTQANGDRYAGAWRNGRSHGRGSACMVRGPHACASFDVTLEAPTVSLKPSGALPQSLSAPFVFQGVAG